MSLRQVKNKNCNNWTKDKCVKSLLKEPNERFSPVVRWFQCECRMWWQMPMQIQMQMQMQLRIRNAYLDWGHTLLSLLLCCCVDDDWMWCSIRRRLPWSSTRLELLSISCIVVCVCVCSSSSSSRLNAKFGFYCYYLWQYSHWCVSISSFSLSVSQPHAV